MTAIVSKREIEQLVEHYMSLPYRVEMRSSDWGWFVRIPDLPGCMSQGESPEDALVMIRDAQRGWLTVTLEDGRPIPEPRVTEDDEETYSGKFLVRVPRRLHRDLARAATAQGVSLNLFAATALARAAALAEGQPSDR